MLRTIDLEIFVEYGFVELMGKDAPPDLMAARAGQRNGICGAQVPGHLSMITGTHTGTVRFCVELHIEAPPVGDMWEDVVEVSVEILAASVQLGSFDEQYDVPGLQPGWHRARYCAQGMDAGGDEDPSEDDVAPDRYLLAMWPSSPAPEVVIRESSNTARYWASVAAGTEKKLADEAGLAVTGTGGGVLDE